MKKSIKKGIDRISSNNSSIAVDPEFTSSILKESAQAGDAAIDFSRVKKVKSTYYKKKSLKPFVKGISEKNM